MNAPPTQPADDVVCVIPSAYVRFRNPLFAAVVMAVLGAAVAWGAIAAGVYNDRANADQNIYHLRVIEQFSREFPRPNLSDYYSATGPGFHLAVALVHRFVSQDLNVLRIAGSLFTIALLAVAGWVATPRVWRRTDISPPGIAPDTSGIRWRISAPLRFGWLAGVLLCAPMLTSLYVFVSGTWLLPDNLAWLCVLLVIAAAWDDHPGVGNFVLATVALTAAVFVRQINLWPLGVIVAAVVFMDASRDVDDPDSLAPALYPDWWKAAAVSLLAGVPALLILAWFYGLWHGLTPPAFQSVDGPLPPGHSKWEHEGPNFAVPAMVMAVLGATGFFFLGLLLPAVRRVLAKRPRQFAAVVAGILVGAALALVVPTEYTPAPGPRYSGLWNISAKFPAIGGRSLFMAAMSAAGGAVAALFFLALGRRERWLWLATWACFAVAQSANAKAWHKYYEPFCLMMLALATARVIARHGAPKWAFLGPLLLAALLAAVTLSNLTTPPTSG